MTSPFAFQRRAQVEIEKLATNIYELETNSEFVLSSYRVRKQHGNLFKAVALVIGSALVLGGSSNR